MVKNKHHVASSVWKEWSEEAKRVFIEMFDLFADQKRVNHPAAAVIPAKHWKTIQWNAAWVAADIASGSNADVLKRAELI